MTILRGRIVDKKGEPVNDAVVYVASAPVSLPDIGALTDEAGQFSFFAPVPGRYTLGARSERWGVTQIDIVVGKEPEQQITIRFGDSEEGP